MRRVVGQSSNPHNVVQTRIRLDRVLFEETSEELDIDPMIESDDVDDLMEEFGAENVQLTYYYLHRHQLFELGIFKADDLEWDDVIAFLIIREERSCYEAQESAKLKSQAERLK